MENDQERECVRTLLILAIRLISLVSELGFWDALTLAQTIGIVGKMVLTLYFSKRQIQALSSDTEAMVPNDLDEKLHKMAEIVIADSSLLKALKR